MKLGKIHIVESIEEFPDFMKSEAESCTLLPAAWCKTIIYDNKTVTCIAEKYMAPERAVASIRKDILTQVDEDLWLLKLSDATDTLFVCNYSAQRNYYINMIYEFLREPNGLSVKQLKQALSI